MSLLIGEFRFGAVRIGDKIYEHDVVVAHGRVRRRKKKRSRPYRQEFEHTPLSLAEKLPWRCRKLIIGTGAHGQLPIMDEVKREAERRHVELVVLPTPEAIDAFNLARGQAAAVLHVTC